ncbi:zinc finger MYM-type protein 1-like [Sycon ciliatum]|uniref:zinc finger MYM-type protein 1-like n=1 Tax=Sycon ciliatum TaxID=27933 RepID=UPI0031F6EEAA
MAQLPLAQLQQFRPGKSFSFPKRKFGTKGDERSFRADWCEQFNWLHYDVGKDAAFCFICMQCEQQKKFLASTKREPAFLSRGFTYWKEGTAAFRKHAASDFHREAIEALIVLPSCTSDVGELQSAQHAAEKEKNRKMFMLMLSNVRFLARQGLALRGDGDETNSNFIQLIHLRTNECTVVDVSAWLERRAYKYTSPEVQDECLQLMALSILRQLSKSIADCPCYSIMADECTDLSNKEQFTICLRWVDHDLMEHEDFIGLYQVDTIDANTLFSAIKDVLLRMNLSWKKCRGQCFDGASNMSGARNGVASKVIAEESRALYTHCYGHALNLAVSDTIKKSKLCKDSLDTAFEITRLIKFSPKRNAAFEKIRSSQNDDIPSPTGIRTFSHTRWTVRGDALESIITNYTTLFQLWNECLESAARLDPDVKARIIGVDTVMGDFKFLFGLKLSETILKITDNLSKALQATSMSAAEAQHVASLTVKTLQDMRSDQSWSSFYALVTALQGKLDVDEPVLPRRRKVPRRFEDGQAAGTHPERAEDLYRVAYFEALDLAVSSIQERFDQPGYAMYRNLEELLLQALRDDDHTAAMQQVTGLYHELDAGALTVQLKALASHFASISSEVKLSVLSSYYSLCLLQMQ